MKNIFPLVLAGILAVPLFSIVPIHGTDVWYSHYVCLTSLLFLGIAFHLWKFNKFMSLFVVACIFSAMVTSMQHPRALLMLIQICLSFLAIEAISNFTAKQRKIILYTILGLVVIQGAWVGMQFLNLDPVFNHIDNPMIDDTVGLSGSHNQIGVFFAVTSPLVLAFCPFLLPLTIAGLYGSTTTIAWLAFIASALFYSAFFLKKFIVLILAILIIVSGVFFAKFEIISKEKIGTRIELVKLAVKSTLDGKFTVTRNFKKKAGPYKEIVVNKFKGLISGKTYTRLFGFGLGNYIRTMPFAQHKFLHNDVARYSHAHNDLAEVFFEMGFSGLIPALLIILDFFRRFLFAHKTKLVVLLFSCVLAHLICSMGVFSVHTALSGMMLILFYALFIGETNGQKTCMV